jgi:hypothetical protein
LSGQRGGAWPAARSPPAQAPRPSLPSAATQALHQELAARDAAAAKQAKKKAKELQEAAWRSSDAAQPEASSSSSSSRGRGGGDDGQRSVKSSSSGRRSKSGQKLRDEEPSSRARSGERRARRLSEGESEGGGRRAHSSGSSKGRRRHGGVAAGESEGGHRSASGGDSNRGGGSSNQKSNFSGGGAVRRKDPLAHPRSASGIQLADDLFDSSSDEDRHEWRGGRSSQAQQPRNDGMAAVGPVSSLSLSLAPGRGGRALHAPLKKVSLGFCWRARSRSHALLLLATRAHPRASLACFVCVCVFLLGSRVRARSVPAGLVRVKERAVPFSKSVNTVADSILDFFS